MSEANFRKFVLQKLRARGFHCNAVESPDTAAGIPDANVCGEGIHEWIEFKYTASAKKGLRLRPAQVAWFVRRVRAGGEPILLAQIDLQPRSYILIRGSEVPKLAGVTSIRTWLETADHVWEGTLVWEELISVMSRYCGPKDDSSSS